MNRIGLLLGALVAAVLFCTTIGSSATQSCGNGSCSGVATLSTTSPIGNSGTAANPNVTCGPCITTAGGQSIAGTTTINTLNLTNPLGIAYGGTGSTGPTEGSTSPITNSGSWPNLTFACATCITTAGGQSISGTTTFAHIVDSELTNGDCVQAGASGALTTTASACGSGGGGGVTSVTASSPISSSGGTTPNITCGPCVTTSGGQSIAGTTTFTGTSPWTLNAGGTGCNGSIACTITYGYTGGVLTITINAPTNTSRLIVNAPNNSGTGGPDQCTGASGMVAEFSKAGSDNLKVPCAGGISVANGNLQITGTGNHIAEFTANAFAGTQALNGASPSVATITLPTQYKGTGHPICPVSLEGTIAAVAAQGYAVNYTGASGSWVLAVTSANGSTATVDWGPCVEVP